MWTGQTQTLEPQLKRVVIGSLETLRPGLNEWITQPIDQEMPAPPDWQPDRFETTLGVPESIAGPGTYRGSSTRTLQFQPAEDEGWWFDRRDLSDALPNRVSVRNVWTTQRNIVLCSGSPHNYMRMVEHIVALKLGLGLDQVVIGVNSGDPPLFARSSMDLVETVEKARIRSTDRPLRYITVREPLAAVGPNNSFLAFLPCDDPARPCLRLDCAVNFSSAMGRQRICFDVTPASFRYGAFARTNTTLATMLYSRTIGKLFADIRNLGYNTTNILIAGKRRYLNEPRLFHNGKSLEAAWHRATLDLLAALALVEEGRFVGTVVSYKAGHSLDVLAIKALYRQKLLVPVAGSR
jgi:UDP-3-O-acyl-N-acetylglucosamine deacetylase